jgi:hypothetical protein
MGSNTKHAVDCRKLITRRMCCATMSEFWNSAVARLCRGRVTEIIPIYVFSWIFMSEEFIAKGQLEVPLSHNSNELLHQICMNHRTMAEGELWLIVRKLMIAILVFHCREWLTRLMATKQPSQCARERIVIGLIKRDADALASTFAPVVATYSIASSSCKRDAMTWVRKVAERSVGRSSQRRPIVVANREGGD